MTKLLPALATTGGIGLIVVGMTTQTAIGQQQGGSAARQPAVQQQRVPANQPVTAVPARVPPVQPTTAVPPTVLSSQPSTTVSTTLAPGQGTTVAAPSGRSGQSGSLAPQLNLSPQLNVTPQINTAPQINLATPTPSVLAPQGLLYTPPLAVVPPAGFYNPTGLVVPQVALTTLSAPTFPQNARLAFPQQGGLFRPPQAPNQTGKLTTATIVTGIEWDDNYNLDTTSPGDVLIWDTTLMAGFVRETEVDSLTADFAGTLRVSDTPINSSNDSNFQADNPTISVNYGRVVDDNNLSFGVNYQRADVSFFDPLAGIDPYGNFDNTFGSGTRETGRANFGLGLNTLGPVSLNFAADTFVTKYYDTSDTSLNDKTISNVLGDVGFQVTPTLQLLMGAAYNYGDFTNANVNSRKTTQADAGFRAQVNPRVDTTFRLGYSRVETDRTTGTSTKEGVVGNLSVVILQLNGQLTGDANATVNDNGTRYNATVGKLVNWTNSSMTATLGATVSQNTSVRPIGTIAYSYQLPRSTFSIGAQQFATVDVDGNDTLNSYLNASWRHSITPVSAFSLIVSGGLQRFENANLQDNERANLTAMYTYSLTQDWNMNMGYRGRYRNKDGTGDATSNSVFVGLQRNFASIR